MRKGQRARQRGVVLSETGVARVNRARRRIEIDRNDGAKISLEQLSFEIGLSAKTISRLLSRELPVDRRTIELLFAGLELTLELADLSQPSARTLTGRAAIPHYRTALFGRETELARLDELSRERVVITLTGAGGVGKTRLAADWIRRVELHYGHIAFLDLSLFTDEHTLHEAVAAVLDDAAADEENILLVLDGCEHIIEAAATTVNRMLDRISRVEVLATSREPLGVDGEAVLRIAPLPVPQQAASLRAADALRSPAFAMFVERARSFDDAFALGDDAVPIVAEIVRRLDGVPLALELAAARAAVMALPDLLVSLNNHLELLSRGPRAGVPRHRSARALIDWSFELLTAQERDVFARLAAFMGSFDAAAVSALCTNEIDSQAGSEILIELVRKSLLVVDASGPVTRFRMLETIRQYAAAKLAESGDAACVRQSHALYYYDLVSAAGSAFGSEQQEVALRTLEIESANVREALEWSTNASRNLHLGAALAARLVEFWEARGDFIEAEHWLSRGMQADPQLLTVQTRAKLHEGLAVVGYRRGRVSEAVDEASRALTGYTAIDDVAGELRARNLLGLSAMSSSDLTTARDNFEAVLREGRATRNSRAISASLNNLGRLLAEHEGRFDEAMPLLVESLEIARASALYPLSIAALSSLSECALGLKQYAAGLEYARLGISEGEKSRNFDATLQLRLQAVTHILLKSGIVAARDDALCAWEALVNVSYRSAVADRLDDVALALHAVGSSRRAAVLLGSTAAFRRRSEAAADVLADERNHAARVEIRGVLAPGEAEALRTRGLSLAVHEAFREALLDVDERVRHRRESSK